MLLRPPSAIRRRDFRIRTGGLFLVYEAMYFDIPACAVTVYCMYSVVCRYNRIGQLLIKQATWPGGGNQGLGTAIIGLNEKYRVTP